MRHLQASQALWALPALLYICVTPPVILLSNLSLLPFLYQKPRPNLTDQGYELRSRGPATLDHDALDTIGVNTTKFDQFKHGFRYIKDLITKMDCNVHIYMIKLHFLISKILSRFPILPLDFCRI